MADDTEEDKDKKNGKKKKGKFLTSKPAIIAYVVFGLPILGLVLFYVYNVAWYVDEKAMRSMEAKIQAEIAAQLKKLKERAKTEGFRIEDYDACKNIEDAYTTPKGYMYEKDDINKLVGMPKTSSDEAMDERCVTIAKAVYKMTKTAHHSKHVTVCEGGRFQLSGSGGGDFWIKPDPKGRGALQNFLPHKKQLIRIGKNGSTILSQWHIFNLGDGCIIIGLSKAGVFRMSGKAIR